MRTTYGFRRPARAGLGSGLYLHLSGRGPRRCLPSSLYTFLNFKDQAWLGITTAGGFPEFDRCTHKSFPLCCPVGDSIPCFSVLCRPRQALTLVALDDRKQACVSVEHVDWEHIEQIKLIHINQREVEVRVLVLAALYHPAIRLGPSRIDFPSVILGCVPSRLDLHSDQAAGDVEHQVVGETIPQRPQHSPSLSHGHEDRGLLCNISLRLRVQG